jgi:hypothetical protein
MPRNADFARTTSVVTFTVSDSIYNFRLNPLEDLPIRADRTITKVYINDTAALTRHGRSRLGRFVIIELDSADPGGNTVIRGRCPSFLCYEKVNPDLLTEVVQNDNIYARPGKGVGRGKLISAGSATPHPVTEQPVNLLVDDFRHEVFLDQFSVDRSRVYVSTYSWGSTLAWDGMANHPGLFTGAQIAAGFPVSTAQPVRPGQPRELALAQVRFGCRQIGSGRLR